MSNEYARIGNQLSDYYERNKEKYNELNQTNMSIIKKFQNEFSPDVIKNVDESKVLDFIFGSKEDHSLFYVLEYDQDIGLNFGQIKGGIAGKRILYWSEKANSWRDLHAKNISLDEATKQALDIRKKLLEACNYLSSEELDSFEDYTKLDRKLYEILGDYTRRIFIRKYLYLLFPDKLYPIYKESLIKDLLRRFGIKPEDNYYNLIGQLHLIKEKAQIPALAFPKVVDDLVKTDEFISKTDKVSDKSILNNESEEIPNKEFKINYKTDFESSFPRNLLLCGAPGTGKSHKLNQQKEELLESDSDYERVTFHPDYTYANFVGTYKPAMDKETQTLTYKFVPGPFARIYAKAIKNSKSDEIHPYLLIIEELNRANAAAVFGDVFQLMDRIDNVSEYPVTISEEFRDYLIDEVGGEETDFESIRLPDNLFIWATMNNADQGVNPIDTAFKRRWNYTPLNINENDSKIAGKFVRLGKNKEQIVEWNKLRKAINEFLAKEHINEDKQLGAFFLNLNEIEVNGNQIERNSFIETFKNKILSYLYEDAAKGIRHKIFSGSKSNYRYSDLCEDFDKNGIKIFNQEIISQTEPEIIKIEDSEKALK